jgi:hypothetical protein
MGKTREILLSQRAELIGQIPAMVATFRNLRQSLIEAEGRLTAVKNELEKIDLALKALDESESKTANITIMQAVLEVLNHKPNGMTALEILDDINANYFNGTILRTSLSPQLSRLKNRDKKIELRGNHWFRLPDEPSLFAPKE